MVAIGGEASLNTLAKSLKGFPNRDRQMPFKSSFAEKRNGIETLGRLG
jgi:hypothetical protein